MREKKLMVFLLVVLGYVVLSPFALLAQVAGGDGTSTTPSESSILSQMALAGYVALKLESLKNSATFRWLTPYTETLTKLWAAAAALVTAIGITWTFERDVTGYGSVTLIGIPMTWDAAWSVGKTMFEQYWATKLIYLGAVKPNATVAPTETVKVDVT